MSYLRVNVLYCQLQGLHHYIFVGRVVQSQSRSKYCTLHSALLLALTYCSNAVLLLKLGLFIVAYIHWTNIQLPIFWIYKKCMCTHFPQLYGVYSSTFGYVLQFIRKLGLSYGFHDLMDKI